jgi:hypothetical protein
MCQTLEYFHVSKPPPPIVKLPSNIEAQLITATQKISPPLPLAYTEWATPTPHSTTFQLSGICLKTSELTRVIR